MEKIPERIYEFLPIEKLSYAPRNHSDNSKTISMLLLEEITNSFAEEAKLGSGKFGEFYKVRLSVFLVLLSNFMLQVHNHPICFGKNNSTSHCL